MTSSRPPQPGLTRVERQAEQTKTRQQTKDEAVRDLWVSEYPNPKKPFLSLTGWVRQHAQFDCTAVRLRRHSTQFLLVAIVEPDPVAVAFTSASAATTSDTDTGADTAAVAAAAPAVPAAIDME